MIEIIKQNFHGSERKIMLEEFTFSTVEQIKAYGNLLRLQLINHLIEKPYTGSQLARKLNIPRQKIHYHLNVLKDCGLITIEKEGEIKGLKEYYYRAIARTYFIPDEISRSEHIRNFMDSNTNKAEIFQTHLRMIELDIQKYASLPSDNNLFSDLVTSYLTPEQLLEILQDLRMLSKKARNFGDENQDKGIPSLQPIRLSLIHVPISAESEDVDLFEADDSTSS